MIERDLVYLLKEVADAVAFGARMIGFKEPLPEEQRRALETALRERGFEPFWETRGPEESTTAILRWTPAPPKPARRSPIGSAIQEVTEQAGLSR